MVLVRERGIGKKRKRKAGHIGYRVKIEGNGRGVWERNRERERVGWEKMYS